MPLPNEAYDKQRLNELNTAVESAKKMINFDKLPSSSLGNLATKVTKELASIEEQEKRLQKKLDIFIDQICNSPKVISAKNDLKNSLLECFKVEPSDQDPKVLVINYKVALNSNSLYIIEFIKSYADDYEDYDPEFDDTYYGEISELSVPAELQITYLDCSYLNLKRLVELPSCLERLDCNYNYIESLPDLPKGLEHLDCSENKLTTLPKLPSGLEYLDCSYNSLESLPDLPQSLSSLNCKENLLSPDERLKAINHTARV